MNGPPSSGVSAQHPFPGLRPFAYQDHEYFFGREDHFYALYRLIDDSRFIAVVGSSGSGKSSLVRAGLLPLLDAETREAGGHSWLWREMRPGGAPLQRLTSLLASLSNDDDPIVASGRRERIAAQLQRSSFGISEALAETNGVTGKSVVLLIDQFEELFRYAAPATGRTGSSGDEVRARDEATQFVQLLLEASRSPSSTIHIVLTMRSDFIGDCARFHGLPEAVSAAQFLVPSLTRDQLDEVIRKPVEKAGATIEPELVERLLNDCSTEMDQLPVLQHCLSRLWEEAGKAPGATAVPSPAEKDTGIGQVAARHLSSNHYRNIGGVADALSQHADEILQDLPGPTLQLAVEQVFSALSELDKEGRAIRRALMFSQLVAETGVNEAAVRQVLDRFRAGDCSFLTPSPSDVKEIGDTTRIDVGHEALLRRWEKVSGGGAELGWLRAERQAGERYRALLAMAEGDRATLPPHLAKERWAWWTARPRTEQWAERYGGGFARVQRLLQASQAAGQRIKRWATAAAFTAVAAIAVTMFWLWQAAVQAQREANENRIATLRTTGKSIERLSGFLDDGTLRAAGAQKFLEDANENLAQLSKEGDHSPEISEIEISMLLAISDVNGILGDYQAATELAVRAETLSDFLVKKYPDRPNLKYYLYTCKLRVGDYLAQNRANAAKAAEKYRAAFEIIKQLAADKPDNLNYQRGVVFAGNRVGDLQQFANNWQGALDWYNAGLTIIENVGKKSPSPAVTREIATQKGRIAQVLAQRGQPGDDLAALAQFREVLAIQEQLLKDAPSNATLLSNAALTHRRIAGLLKDKPDEAERQYEAAVAYRKRLYADDPGNMNWGAGLVRDYTSLGDVLMQREKWQEALQIYNAAIGIAESIILRNPVDKAWQKRLAELNAKRGDAARHRGDIVVDQPKIDESPRLIEERSRITAPPR
jgi:energy-coupling factor transporter ATP-binding protein EcfA2